MRTRSPSPGLGDQNDRKHPVLLTSISGRNIRKISCGNSHSMFLSDRDVFTFGCGGRVVRGGMCVLVGWRSRAELLGEVLQRLAKSPCLQRSVHACGGSLCAVVTHPFSLA